jgi:hypothetical protein
MLLAAMTVLAPAEAAGQARDSAGASELFRQGREALLRKDYAEACPKLAESQRLDPKVGTLINLAQCEEQTGKLAAALRSWADAQALARAQGDAREPYVDQQHDGLALRVPRLVVRLAPGSPVDTRVTVGGVEIEPADLGTPLPVDAGLQEIVAKAARHADARFEASTSEGQTTEISVDAGPVTPDSPATSTAGPTEAPRPSASGPFPPRAGGAGAQRWSAYGVGGLGLVALGLGVAWGVQAVNAKAEPGCSNGVCATQAEAQVQRDGRSAGDRSTVAFIAGGALIAGGVALWWTAPRTSASTGLGVRVSGTSATIDVGGAW